MPTDLTRRPTHVASLCNVGRAVLALLDADGVIGTVDVDMAPLGRGAGGTVGVTFHDGRCYAAVQSDPPAVAVFDAAWRQVALFEPREVKDIHGLAVHGGELLIVSTGTNQVVAVDLDGKNVRPFWSERDALCDTVHLNDIAVADGRVVGSRFGPRHAGGQRNGEVFDLLTGETLAMHLREPHSVAFADGAVHVLESATGDLVRFAAGFIPRRAHGIVGYARGLAMGPATIAIGKSGYRQTSRQGIGDSRLAPLAPTEAAAEAHALSGVFFVDRATGAARFVDTTALGPEIYGVAAVPLPEPRPMRPRRRGVTTAAAP